MIYMECADRAVYTPGVSTTAEADKGKVLIKTFDKDGRELAKFEFTEQELETLTTRRL